MVDRMQTEMYARAALIRPRRLRLDEDDLRIPRMNSWECQVRWNNAERTLDCPCHGSRYDVDGNAISAPTAKGLSKRGGRGAEQQR